jgi:uncharacterized protein (DUF1810 family)
MRMDLDRFIDAQNQTTEGYQAALEELRTTGKQSHWIWYIFPQLDGLGGSADARYYALAGIGEAIEYLKDPVLGARLLTISSTVAERLREGLSLRTLMNSSTDVRKLVSCMTLFWGLAERLAKPGSDATLGRLSQVATELLAAAESEGFPPCRFTLERLRSDHLNNG